MTDTKHPLRIFLSYASEDKPAVRTLYKHLVNDGFDAWLDEKNLLIGQSWREEISRAIRASDVVIICLSKRSITKEGYVQKEIRYALDIADELPEGTFFLIPAKLEDCNLPDRLQMIQAANLYETNGYINLQKALRQINNQISLSRTSLTQPPKSTTQKTDPDLLERNLALSRRELTNVEQEATGYSVLTLPLDIARKLDEKRKEISLLEAQLSKVLGRISPNENLRSSHLHQDSHIFLSYSREDVAIMTRIKNDLNSNNFTIWVDELSLELGTPTWETAIQKALERSRCVIVLMSPDSKRSIWVTREISYAEMHNIRIFPVLIKGDELDAVPLRLSSTMWVDARTDYSTAMQRLFISMRKQVGAE